MARAAGSMTLDGAVELERALTTAMDAKTRAKIATEMRQAMKDIVLPDAKARALAFPDAPPIGKRIGNSLKIGVPKKKRYVVAMGVKTGTRKQLGISQDDKHYYPLAVEYGQSRRKDGRYVPPHPYMRPALWNNEQRLITRLGRKVRLIVRERWRRRRSGPLRFQWFSFAERKSLRPRA